MPHNGTTLQKSNNVSKIKNWSFTEQNIITYLDLTNSKKEIYDDEKPRFVSPSDVFNMRNLNIKSQVVTEIQLLLIYLIYSEKLTRSVSETRRVRNTQQNQRKATKQTHNISRGINA